MPPPASITQKTFGQWSRPAVLLIFGVRPNSEVTMTSVESSRPRSSRSRIRAARALVEGWHLLVDAVLDIVVVVPAAVGHRDEADAGLDEAAGEEHALAGLVAAVLVAQLVVLGVDVERLACLLVS